MICPTKSINWSNIVIVHHTVNEIRLFIFFGRYLAIGWYVIHENKNLNKKQHLLTLHGKLGAAVCCIYFMIGIFGFLALHPDFGMFKENKQFRLMHKWGGRVATAAAWVTSVLGLMKLQTDPFVQLSIGMPLVILGLFVLL